MPASRIPFRCLVVGLTAVALRAPAAAAVEPWSDPALKVTDGLELWLDVTRLYAGEGARPRPPLADGAAVEVWPDASGQGRDARQSTTAQRPVLETSSLKGAAGAGALRFDGQDDSLIATGLGQRFDACTLLVVAAPLSNPGFFRGLFAFNAANKNDYVTGLTLDLGPSFSTTLNYLNFEGAGFGGAVNLLGDPLPMGKLQMLAAVSAAGTGNVRLYVNGKPAGRRDRQPGKLIMDDLHVGARFYSNTGLPATNTGFLDGYVAEVLLYGRALDDRSRADVEAYLQKKYAPLTDALAVRQAHAAEGHKPLVAVDKPPDVQMLAPGCTVRQLPLELPNINNVKYREDGKLVALAYDGTLYLLSDSDGDGLEDKATPFWNRGGLLGPIGMALTPPGYKQGRGAFVPSKGKLSLIVDTDGDDVADREIVVATGWKQIPQSVDALGVALDKEGNVYFGLGTQDYSNAYVIDREGKPHYDIQSERGTILKVSPDFSRREKVCTGVRFTVALAMNRHGDLFASEQEGATWLPNGNPFDELLHILPGRHYGFPPRHPRHLPGVIDEPSVVDYAPQHQSTCGLNFNEPVAGGRQAFGPDWWQGDALVCGYSRGKIYRSHLVKSTAGYVAQTSLMACLNHCTVDACVAPDGGLVVSVHSGLPDWGTGPAGKGKLYKVTYSDREAPQPVLAWPAASGEVRVAFDRPLRQDDLSRLASNIEITAGKYVAAGDRFEVLRPGYQVVQDQLNALRRDVPVRGMSVSPDLRTLTLAVDPLTEAMQHELTIRGMHGAPRDKASPGELPQQAATDLAFNLAGVEARWQSSSGDASWSGWLPHFDLQVARELTAQSAEHARLWKLLEQPGKLTLRAKLNLADMLRPLVQPGSQIDYQLPPERVTVVWKASGALKVSAAGALAATEGEAAASITVTPQPGELIPVEVELGTGAAAASLEVSYFTAEDSRPRALALSRALVPWARIAKPGETPPERVAPPELAGGDWLRGRNVFFSNDSQCAKCHTFFGSGGVLGPNLSNLPHRDYASVLRDITKPSFAINPEYISHAVAMDDGRLLVGTLRTEGDNLVVGDTGGKQTTVDRRSVESLKPSTVSIMPEGLPKTLGPERMRDLLTFLLMPPPQELRPAPLSRTDAPPGRTPAELDAVLKGAENLDPQKLRPRRIVLVGGPKDHGPDEHDYPSWQKRWAKLLALADKVEVSTASVWPSPDDFKSADLLVWYSANPGWAPDKAKEMDAFFERGGGMVFIHFAVNAQRAPEELAKRIGLVWQGGSKFRHGPLDLAFAGGEKHPIARGFDKVHFVDETYWQLGGDERAVNVLATAVEEGRPRPLLWTYQPGKGRVFCSILGHYSWTFDDPLFRVLLLRGMAWSMGESVDRFNELATIGVRWRDRP